MPEEADNRLVDHSGARRPQDLRMVRPGTEKHPSIPARNVSGA